MADTKVTYDIADAIRKLNDLNKKLGEVADRTIEAFSDKGSRALDTFTDHLNDVSPAAARVVGKLRDVTSAFGPMGLVAGTAAVGLAAVVSNLIDLPNLLRDSAGAMDAFNKAVDRHVRIFEKFDDISDAFAKAANERSRDELTLKRAEIAGEQAKLSGIKSAALQELEIAKNVVRQKEDLIRDSIKRREDLERKLTTGQNAQEVLRVEQGAGTQARAVGDLSARAQRAAAEGNVELAGELRDRAQELTEELGGHVFFQRQVDQATSAISANLEKQVRAEEQVQSKLQAEVAAAKQIADERERDVRAIQEQERLLRVQSKEIRKAAGKLSVDERVRERRDVADVGATEVNAAIVKIRRELTAGGQSLSEQLKNSLSAVQGGIFGGAGRIEGSFATEREAFQGIGKLAETLLKPGGVTGREIQDIQPIVAKLDALTGAIEESLGGKVISAGQQDAVNQLNRFISSFEQIAEGTARFAANPENTPDTLIRRREEGVLVQPARDLSSAAENFNRGTARLAGVPTASAGIPTQAPRPATAGGPQSSVPSSITVNANVKGGIIDRETTESIVDIIRREIRKLTGNSISP